MGSRPMIFFITLLLLAFCLPVTITFSHAQPALLASWPFNNNSDDASGNGFHATLRGRAGYSEDAAKGSHSLLLNGTSAYARVGAFDFADEFTICAWVLLEPDVTNIQTIIGNAMGGSTVDGFKLFVNSWETNNKRIIIETSDGSARLDATSPENTFEEGFWNFVAVTIDRINGEAHIYYNSEEVTESGAVVPGFQATQSVTIGSMSGPDWYWTGMIDDVRIYQRVLTAEEIDDVMNSPETGVNQKSTHAVDSFNLFNTPNPFNPSTTIVCDLPNAGHVRLFIYDQLGHCIRTLLEEDKPAGRFQVNWDGRDERGMSVAGGVYFCRMQAGEYRSVVKMVLVR